MNKGSKKILTCVVTILIISIGMTLFVFRTNVQAAIFGTKYYYLALEKDNFDKLKNNFKDSNLKELTSEFKLNAELNGEFINSSKEMKTIADYLSKFELFINYSANSKNLRDVYYTSLISTKYDGKTLADMDIKSADNKTLIAFPGLTNKTIGIKNSKMASKLSQAILGDETAFEEFSGMNREAYNKLIQRYLKDVIVNAIPDENVVFNNNANFENIECNSITFNMDKKVVAGIYKALAKEIVSDKELNALITSMTYSFLDVVNEKKSSFNKPSAFDVANEQAFSIKKPTAEEIDSVIKAFCDELNDEAENMNDIQFSYTAYFKDDGDILSRQFKDKVDDVEATLSTYKNLFGVNIFEFNVGEKKETIFEVIASRLQKGSTYVGDFNVNISGKSLIDSNYSYEKDAKVGNLDAFVGEIDGKINVEQFSDYFGKYSFEDDYKDNEDNNVSDIDFTIVNKKKDNDTLTGETKITSKVNGKSVGIKIFTEQKQSNAHSFKPEVSLEKSIKQNDYLALNELGTEISESLQKKVLEFIPFLSDLKDGDIQ